MMACLDGVRGLADCNVQLKDEHDAGRYRTLSRLGSALDS